MNHALMLNGWEVVGVNINVGAKERDIGWVKTANDMSVIAVAVIDSPLFILADRMGTMCPHPLRNARQGRNKLNIEPLAFSWMLVTLAEIQFTT